MPRLRGTKYLTCFYCGKRSNTKFDGTVHDFLCLFCDATNYLDESGDITDPPVATEREAPATLYAAPRQSSPAASQSQDNIFCSTCLKNQRLFTSSLAQYLPDKSDPDYDELYRNRFRFRKGLEERYPQVCDECAERVEARIAQAGYTAKTDHLRRMIDKTRGKRGDPGRTTILDWANTLGRGLWWGGLVFQMLWHLSAVSDVLKHRDEGMYDPDDKSWPVLAVSGLAWVVAFLPPAETLINGAFTTSILSVWWNPQFVQVSRGFTRHLLGFTQWYSFQGLIVFFRFFFGRVLEMDGGQAQSRGAQLSAHLIMAAIMILVYTLAKGSIRIDTTPLFGTHSTTVSPRQTKPKPTRRDEQKTFSDSLNEALDSPPTKLQRDTLNRPLINSLPSPYPPINPMHTRESPHIQMKSLGISPQTPSQTRQIQYSEEMDWTPTQSQSQHRAFREMPSSTGPTRAFGGAPVNPEGSPFWYKVPAAPTTPAQRLRNPNAPILRSKPAPEERVLFRASDRTKTQTNEEDLGDVAFKAPSFFAPATENDDTNSLADLLNQSFSLGQEKDQPGPSPSKPSRWTSANRRPTTQTQKPLSVEFVIIACLLALWLLTVAVPVPFGRELQLAVLSAAGTIALRVTGETSQEAKDEAVPSTATYVGSVLSVIELTAVCWLGWEVWKSEADSGRYGVAVLVTMLGHQVWNAAM